MHLVYSRDSYFAKLHYMLNLFKIPCIIYRIDMVLASTYIQNSFYMNNFHVCSFHHY